MSDSVHVLMGRILAELPAIGKNQLNKQQGFKFRGHDDVLDALNPILSKYGVFPMPQVLERVTSQRSTAKGGVMYEVNLHVLYRFYGPNGDYVEGSAWGEGTDSGDKSTNKAMTNAFKNVLQQAFAISTQEQRDLDSDHETPPETTGRRSSAGASPDHQRGEGGAAIAQPTQRRNVAVRGPESQASPPQPSALHEALTAKIKGLSDDQKGKLREFCGENGIPLVVKNMSPEQVSVVLDFLRGWEVIAQQFPGVEYAPDDPERPM